MPPLAEREPPGFSRHVPRGVWLALGWLLVALGFIGALLPLMPTTIISEETHVPGEPDRAAPGSISLYR